VAELRKELGITQKQFAKMISVSKTTFCSYENNHTTPCDDTKIKIGKILDVSMDYLLGATDERLPLNKQNVLVLPISLNPEEREKVMRYALSLVSENNDKRSKSGRTYGIGRDL